MNEKDTIYAEEIDYAPNEDQKDYTDIEKVKLKYNRLSLGIIHIDLLGFLRSKYLIKYEGPYLSKMTPSRPVDILFEIQMCSLAINLLQFIKSRFQTQLEDDLKELKNSQMDRRKFALIYRINHKKILDSNLRILNLLIRILENLRTAPNFFEGYQKQISELETQEEIMKNRLILRKYLKLLHTYSPLFKK